MYIYGWKLYGLHGLARSTATRDVQVVFTYGPYIHRNSAAASSSNDKHPAKLTFDTPSRFYTLSFVIPSGLPETRLCQSFRMSRVVRTNSICQKARTHTRLCVRPVHRRAHFERVVWCSILGHLEDDRAECGFGFYHTSHMYASEENIKPAIALAQKKHSRCCTHKGIPGKTTSRQCCTHPVSFKGEGYRVVRGVCVLHP